jgi:cytochrome P450
MEDILSLLLSAQDDQGQPLSDTELRDELVSALLAGTHTTGTAMAWCFERLLSEPFARNKVLDELAAAGGGGSITPAHWPQLRYLDAAIKEALRLRPIAPVGGLRLVKQPFAIGDYVLPPGTTVGSCAYLTFKDPALYPDPAQYRPERFLDTKVDPYAFAAFGGGIRRCLGMAFALNLLKGVVATVLGRTSLAIVTPHARPARHAFFVAPEAGLQVQLGAAQHPARHVTARTSAG